MSKILSREEILASDDLKPTLTAVEVPAWGGTLYVRMMTGAERDALEGLYVKDKYDNYRAAVAVACVCDESGKSIFQAGDVKLLGDKAAGPLGRIFDAAMEVNKFRAEDVEQAAKNSEASPGDASS
jgi:hypothetical protein